MKELSIEEKAKRYDEALKVLHKYDGANVMFSQSLKEEMFPELRESEDERAKNEIRHLVMQPTWKTEKEFRRRQELCTWLEKQGERDDERYTSGKTVWRPTEERSGLPEIKESGEWSEDDEEIRSWIEGDLKTLLHAYAKSDAIYRMETKWLNTLQWRVSAQPQAELTDEQLAQAKKDAFNAALDKIEYRSGEPTFDDGWSAAVAFLTGKPFAGKDGWKPTEEQLEALEWSLRDYRNVIFEERHNTLTSLYNDLRKLL